MLFRSLLIWLGRGNPFGPVLVERVLLLNPAATALAEMKAPGFETFQLIPAGWIVGLGICAIGLIVLFWRIAQMTRPD